MFNQIFLVFAASSVALAAPAIQQVLASSTAAQEPTQSQFPLPEPLAFNETVPNVDYSLIADLRESPNQVTRIALLQDSDFKYDFNAPPDNRFAQLKGKGGTITNAFGITFPTLIDLNIAMVVIRMSPCGFNTPHHHPRASELNIIIKGQMIGEFVQENGARKIRNTYNELQMAVFPQGATHLQFNPTCEETVLIASFNSDNPGVNSLGETLFELDDTFISLATGIPGSDIERFRGWCRPPLRGGLMGVG